MGAVYLGQHTLLGRRAAIKVLLPELSSRPDIVNRFFNEARAVTSISDPGIVQVFDFGYHTDGSAYIVMEYLEGEPLDRRLTRLGRLSVSETLRLCRQLAGSLAAAHSQRIVHRDLKPENVFLVRDAEVAAGERCKILDFGIAKLSDDHPHKSKTRTGVLMGTPVYMSPEQCRGLADIDHRSDIYSLGCVVFRLLAGRPPFDGEGPGDVMSAHIREPAPRPSSYAPDVPPSVDALVLRCLAKAPAERFQTMTELAAAATALHEMSVSGAGAAPAYHAQPTANPPLHGTPVPPPPSGTSPGARTGPGPVAPTTLGSSAGQFAAPGSRDRRVGLWIAGGLVVAAAVIGVMLVSTSGTSGPAGPRAASPAQPGAVTTPAAPSSTGGGSAAEPAVRAQPAPAATAGETPSVPSTPAPGTAPTAPAPAAAPSPPEAGAATGSSEPRPGGDAPAAQTTRPASVPGKKPAHRKAAAVEVPREPAPEPAKPPPALKPAPPPAPPAPKPAAPAATCGKAAFAAVYNAAAPSKEAVRAAIRNLNGCHSAGAISDAEYEQTQAALVSRF